VAQTKDDYLSSAPDWAQWRASVTIPTTLAADKTAIANITTASR
jgi:hypothetical protein